MTALPVDGRSGRAQHSAPLPTELASGPVLGYTINGRPLTVKNTFIHVEDGGSSLAAAGVQRSMSAPRPRVAAAAAGLTGGPAPPRRPPAAPAEEPAASACFWCGSGGPQQDEDDALSEASTTGGSGRAKSLGESECTDDRLSDHECQKTTVILKNLPESFSRDVLVALLESEGFSAAFDFVYLPLHFSYGTSFGYAFVNLVSSAEARRFWGHFEGFCRWGVPSTKVGSMGWSDYLQGLESNVNRYRDSRMMHETMPDNIKAVVFEAGKRVAFPPPTKPLQRPRERQPKKQAAAAQPRLQAA